jgi:hypothetical protein
MAKYTKVYVKHFVPFIKCAEFLEINNQKTGNQVEIKPGKENDQIILRKIPNSQ